MNNSKSGALSESIEVIDSPILNVFVLYSIPANNSLVFEAIWVLQRGENSKLSYWYFCEQIISEIDSHSVLLEVQPSMKIINWNDLIDVMAERIQEMIIWEK